MERTLLGREWSRQFELDVPSKKLKYVELRKEPEVEQLTSTKDAGLTGEVLTRIDNNMYGGHMDWLPAGSVAPPPSNYAFERGLTETTPGTVDLDIATDTALGGITEPPPDGLDYVRRNTAGTAAWQQTTAGTVYIWNVGLTETTPGTIDLNVANLGGEIGGVLLSARDATQGLELDGVTGLLTAPLATDLLAGSIVEPPPDGLLYVRQRDTLGVSGWVELVQQSNLFTGFGAFNPTGLEPISNTIQHIITLSGASVPTKDCDWIVEGTILSCFFAHNIGAGQQAVTGNGGSWIVALEYPTGSGIYIDVATLSFNNQTFPDADARIVRCNPVASGANRVFHYTLGETISFGLRFSGGTNSGNTWSIFVGLQGQILK